VASGCHATRPARRPAESDPTRSSTETTQSSTESSTTTQTTTFPLAVQLEGDGTVASKPGGILCTSSARSCTQSFDDGTAVVLSETPGSTSEFAGWDGDCAQFEREAACTVTVDGPKAVMARFTTTSATSSGVIP
jgi:hypothetical protein